MSKSRSGAPKRVAAGLLASALATFGLALAPSAGAVEVVNAERLAGATRYGTAAAIAVGEEDGVDAFAGSSTVILATGENYPDALAASGLAGANAPAPILLTPTGEVSSETTSALEELGTTDIIIVGGSAAVSPDVEDFYSGEGYSVTRVAGTDRYETAAEIADEIGSAGDFDGLATALIASGENYPDALAGGPIAYAGGHPILLVNSAGVPAATESALTDLGVEQVIILGGTAPVSNDTQAELEGIVGNDAIRLAGVNRYATAVAIADHEIDELGWSVTDVLLASGENFPDALAGGPLGGELMAPVLLTAKGSLSAETEAFLDAHSDTIANVWVLGGPAAIEDGVLDEAQAAAENVDNDDDTPAGNTVVTDAPELVSAAFVTQSAPASTTVRFTFDEAVTGNAPVAGSFHLYTNGMVTYNGQAAQVDSTNTSSVLVTFATTAEQFGQVTLATVDAGAVRDVTGAGGKNNPEGDAPMAAQSATAGATNAPDLVSVGNFRANTTGDGVLVDFTFDEAAFTNGAVAAIYGLVTAANTDLLGLANEVFGNGTVTHSVNFNGVNTTQLNTLTIARGYNTTNGIRDAANTLAPQEIAETNGTGNTSGPDLVSVTFNQDATNTIGGAIDQATYEFDEPVTVTDATDFYVYNVGGTQTAALAATATRSTTNDRQVVVNFPDGLLASAVGAGVTDAAVNAASGDLTRTNQNDEVPVQGVSFAAGLTSGPDLIGARLVTETSNAFTGAVSTYSVVYTFDEAISATVVPANFKVYAGTAGAFGSALTGPFAVGGTNGCTVARSATNTSEAVMSGCTAAGASGLTPTNAFLNGGFVLAAVDVANVANGATQVAGNGAVSDGTLPNPEGSQPITQPAA